MWLAKATVASLSWDTMPTWVLPCLTLRPDYRFLPRGGRSGQHHEIPQSWLWVSQPRHRIATPGTVGSRKGLCKVRTPAMIRR